MISELPIQRAVEKEIKEKLSNALFIKVNKFGSVSEISEAVKM
jgi:Enolase, C-terminal TIM barrel domain.